MSGRGGTPRSSLDRYIAAVQTAGLRHTIRGDHVQAECPVHDDQRPSLSADYKSGDGQTVLHCQTGACDPTEIVFALELTWPMLYDDYEEPDTFAERRAQERAQQQASGRPARRRSTSTSTSASTSQRSTTSRSQPVMPKGRLPARLSEARARPVGEWAIATTYDYTDTRGTVIHQEVRHQRPVEVVDPETGEVTTATEKRFTQRWPDDRGGWVEKTPPGFVPVLYRLPDLREWITEGRRVWLCEGVKDTDRLLELDEAATTNPSGAGNFKAEQADALTGAHVVAVLDHDLAGYRRARRLTSLLAGKAASLRFALPVTDSLHADLSDHLDAGHPLADLVEVDAERLVMLEHTAEAESAAAAAASIPTEAAARRERAIKARKTKATRRAADEQRYAARWAAEASKQLVRATAALEAAVQHGPVAADLQGRLVTAVTACQVVVVDAHTAAGVSVPPELGPYLEAPSIDADQVAARPGGRTATEGELENGAGGTVVDLPGALQLPEPSGLIPMSRGTWAYELGGEGRRGRGVYQLVEGRWARVAPLPHLHARIISRDGYGRPLGTFYLVSAEPDGMRVTIGHEELVKHTWPNILGLAVSHDDRILKAATTAVIFAAEAETDVVEATPRFNDDGTLALPVPETLPPGYLRTSPLDRPDALAVWRDLLTQAALSPRMALVLGASAIGPFLSSLRFQPHIVSLYGDMNMGKSVTMAAAAAIWGDPGSETHGGVCISWDLSNQAPTAFLGELGVLPAFFDEHGMAAPKTTSDWGRLIFRICQGASRGRPSMNGRPGFQSGRKWYGVLVSSGNSRLMEGVGAGDMSGTQRRVVELPTPFTLSEDHSQSIEPLVPMAYGHIGAELLQTHNVETVRGYVQRAAELVGAFEHPSPVAGRIVEHMHAHVAGAMLLDDLAGAEGALTAAAVDGAHEYLEQWTAPVHDADRIIDYISDSLFREPARWPTVAQHLEAIEPPTYGDGSRSVIPTGGVDRNRLGLTANSGEWVAVIPGAWDSMCAELEVDSYVACRELIDRGVLVLQQSGSRHGNKTNQCVIKVGGKAQRFYKLDAAHLQPEDDDAPGAPGDGPSAADTDSGAPAPAGGSLSGADHEPTGATGEEVTDIGVPTPGVTAETRPVTPTVTGSVTGRTPPLTCEVTGVTGVTGKPSHTGARARGSLIPEPLDTTPAAEPHAPVGADQPADPEPTSSAAVVRLDPDEPRPACVVCGKPAGQFVDGRPVHLGPCRDRLPEPSAGADPVASAATEPTQSRQPGTRRRGRGDEPSGTARAARFTAPAACLDHDGLHLAHGVVRPWAELAHLGELAALTGRDQLRLGWGGGEDRLPDPGQIWLYPAALERLGLPTEIPLPEEFMTRAQRAKHLEKLFSRLDDHPLVAGAREAGWQLGQGGHLSTWTRIWHPELLPGGAFLVGLPWHHLDGVPLYDDDPAPGVLARRLHLFAQHVGIAFRLTPTATGLDLIDHHRPPRRDDDDDRGAGRRRVALVRGVGAELPPWCSKPGDARFSGIEQDFSWWRPWDTVPASEQGRRYVHGYDRNASYLAPWRGIELGVEQLQHRTGDAAAWDGRERPGYYLVDKWAWETWGLPDPAGAAGAPVGNGRVWVTVHTLRQLAAHGITPQIHEAYTWAETSRYLEGPGKALAEARTLLTNLTQTSSSATAGSTVASTDDGANAAAVLATVKLLYAATVGKLAEREHRPDFHLWRPDWRDHVIAATRTAILHTVTKAAELSNEHPLVVDRDAIFYASDDPDPRTAWPGDPAKLGTALGSWKPIGTGELATWGPTHLTKRTGRWRYSDAVDALTVTLDDAEDP